MSNTPGTATMPGRITRFAFQRFRVAVFHGPDQGRAAESNGHELSIGSAPENDLVLTDPTVSRHHCVITATPQGVLLRDLDSTNGSTLAGYRVGFAYLRPGAPIGVGLNELRFETLAETVGEPVSSEESCGRLLGRSVGMRRVFALLPRIAASDATVLLEGETGTGKGLLAEAIHQGSHRASGPFVVIDCGAIPPTLIESELFGHVRGAFTGAHATRQGAFEAARGGTIFLDEIGELPLEMQPNLLRVLEERVVKPVGTVESTRVDVRVIAATNKDLRQAINRRTFRSDLYYRLNVVRLELPPLRERREDIPLLVARFYSELGGEEPEPPPDLVRALAEHDFPGNIRELRAAVERAILMGDPQLSRTIFAGEPTALPPGAIDVFDPGLSFRFAKEKAMARWERWYVNELVRQSGGNLSQAARQARMDRTHLRQLLRRYNASARDE